MPARSICAAAFLVFFPGPTAVRDRSCIRSRFVGGQMVLNVDRALRAQSLFGDRLFLIGVAYDL